MHQWTRTRGAHLFFRYTRAPFTRVRRLAVPPQPSKLFSFRCRVPTPQSPLARGASLFLFFPSSVVHSSSRRHNQHSEMARGDLEFEFLHFKTKESSSGDAPASTHGSVGASNPLRLQDGGSLSNNPEPRRCRYKAFGNRRTRLKAAC